MMVTSVGHDSLESMKWVWENCPIREYLDLDGAIGQGLYGKFDRGPRPILDYLVDECCCKITIEKARRFKLADVTEWLEN